MVAEEISSSFDCDVEEIIDTKNRSGILAYIKSGYEASRKVLTVIKDIEHDPASYDLIIIGTPVWASNMATPVRTYIQQHQANFNNVAFFCTAGGSGFDSTFSEMADLSGASPVARLSLKTKEVKDGDYKSKVAGFIDKIKQTF